MKKKFRAGICIMLIMVLILTGCGQNNAVSKVEENQSETKIETENEDKTNTPEKETGQQEKTEISEIPKYDPEMIQRGDPGDPPYQASSGSSAAKSHYLGSNMPINKAVYAKIPKKLLERKLSDSELKEMIAWDYDKLKESISTIPDAIVYMGLYSDIRWESDMDQHETYTASGSWSLKTIRNGVCGTSQLNNFVLGMISDDYPDSGILVGSILGSYEIWGVSSLYLKVDNEYLIFSPAEMTDLLNRAGKPVFQSTILSSLDEAANVLKEQIFNQCYLFTLFDIPSGQDEVTFKMTEPVFSLLKGNANLLYLREGESVKLYDEYGNPIIRDEDRQRKIARSIEQVNSNFNQYGLSTSKTPSWEEAKSWYGLSLNELASKVDSIEDVIYFFAATGFNTADPGVDIKTLDMYDNDFVWHCNAAPQISLKKEWGCCGACSGLCTYLLNGDYDEVGTIQITFAEGEGGGHIVVYVKDGSNYIVFDPVNVTSNYSPRGLNLSKANTLSQAATLYESKARDLGHIKLMAAISFNEEGDGVTAWGPDGDHKTYIPRIYNGFDVLANTQILKETPDEGYLYEWVDMSTEMQTHIRNNRYRLDTADGLIH